MDRTNEPDDETKLRNTDVAAEITRRRSKPGIDSPAMTPDEPTCRRGPTPSAGALDPMAMLGADQTRTRDPAQSSRPGAALDPGDCIRRRYLLERLIGSGGMGQVWKAKDLVRERARDPTPFVAIKLLNSDFEADPDAFICLQRETKKAQELAHPNVITVFDFDTEDVGSGRAFMSMELLEGETLDALIDRHPTGMTRVEALPLIIGMAKGLEYAHKKGIVHSDLKPGNVFVTESGVPKVLDFGIARAAKAIGVERKEDSFDAGTLGGLTLRYASPEMIERLEPHFADDVYALGLIAYQLLTGRYPFRQRKATDARDDGARPARIRTVRRYEWHAIARALEFDRSKRWQNAGEFLRAYEGKSVAAMVVGAVASAPFESLPAEVQTEFRAHMANAEGEWRLVQEGLGDESLNAASEFGKAYALHPRNPDATEGLKKSADYILNRLSRIDDRADRLQKLKEMQEVSDYYASYKPVVAAIREAGGGK